MTRRILVPLAVASLLNLAGCAGDDEDPTETIGSTVPAPLAFDATRATPPAQPAKRIGERLDVGSDKASSLPAEARRLPFVPGSGNGGSLPRQAYGAGDVDN